MFCGCKCLLNQLIYVLYDLYISLVLLSLQILFLLIILIVSLSSLNCNVEFTKLFVSKFDNTVRLLYIVTLHRLIFLIAKKNIFVVIVQHMKTFYPL